MNIRRLSRLVQLMTLLRSGRRFDPDNLTSTLSISRRTLFRDLKVLEQAGWGHRFDHDSARYVATNGFLLPPLHLELDEALALLLLTRRFLTKQVHPQYRHALSAALKIESSLPASLIEHCGVVLDGISLYWPPSSPADASADLFDMLQRALADHVRVKVRYDSVYDGREIDVLLEPRRLVFMSRGWYLIAWSLSHHELRTFKVDRILRADVTEDRFEPDPHFSESDYFGAAWQMIPEGKVYYVKLRFSSAVAASVEEVRWHPSQMTSRDADGRLVFEARVDGLREISSWILGYGEHVEILAPGDLRELVRRRAEQIVAAANAVEASSTGTVRAPPDLA